MAKQVAARKALVVLKKKYETENTPATNDMTVVVERLEKVQLLPTVFENVLFGGEGE